MMSHREAYIEEATDLLRELETSLLELEQNPGDSERVGRVFRALHTIKGSGSMFGFDAVAAFTHELETAFDGVREGRNPVTAELIGITLDAGDHIRELLRASDGTNELVSISDGILGRLRRLVGDVADEPKPQIKTAPAASTARSAPALFRIRFEPQPDILLSGTNPILLLRELSQLGDLKLSAHPDRLPSLGDFNADQCYTWWEADLTTAADENAIRDVFIFVEDRARIDVRRSSEASSDAVVPQEPRLDRAAAEVGQKAEPAATLRIPAAKLDALVNIVGELVTVQARLSGHSAASRDPELALIAEEVERLTGSLRETAMSARMLPIGETFSRFKRVVRDLSADLGKRVELTMEGADTELDKSVIERLNDPLVHLIRNAVDHGIETPEERCTKGKSPTGRVHLSACYSGAFVLIQVRDDGGGMDRDAIRARAMERGLISADAALSDQEILALTLTPGFSTAERVTAVSGRGVGLDVVRRNLDALRGAISISSERGQGTAVTLKIPLTLAIIDGLLLEAAGSFFVVPLASISECIELERRLERSTRHSLINVRGEWIPYITLRRRFQLPGDPPSIEQVIVAETRCGRCGFVVDRVIGAHNTVIKKLGNLYRNVEDVSGATILGDGAVALILDVDKISMEALRDGCSG